jgi:hypothetical protein
LPAQPGRAVVVCAPASVLANWARELKKWGYFGVGLLGTGQPADERDTMVADALAGRLEAKGVRASRQRELEPQGKGVRASRQSS